ncbi:NADPH-dependent oxidoreductase, partial [Brevibacillus sp. SIMBA_076]
ILSELSIAHVRVHPALSLFTDFENGTHFAPKDVQAQSFNDMLDQLLPWTEAMQSVRTKAGEVANN